MNATLPTTGYVDCACCGITIIGHQGSNCDACLVACQSEPTAAEGNWHCFTGHCDGSGCTYPGECEDDDDDDDDTGCPGHESLSGAHMGESVYCDGSCQPAGDTGPERDAYWYTSA